MTDRCLKFHLEIFLLAHNPKTFWGTLYIFFNFCTKALKVMKIWDEAMIIVMVRISEFFS
jgi:hypothetical protein